MKQKILTIGSLTEDHFLRPRREKIFLNEEKRYLSFVLGDKVRIQDRAETFGGGGANVAVGLSRFGLQSAVLGRVGNDEISRKIIRNLHHESVETNFLQMAMGGSGFSMILSAQDGERTVFFCPGQNAHFNTFDKNILSDFDAVALQHLSSKSEVILENVFSFFHNHPEKFLSWNPGRENLEKGIDAFSVVLPVVHFLLLNREEAELFTGTKKLSEILNIFFQKGFSGKLVISDGQKGAIGYDGKNAFSCPILAGRSRRDTLGAGDGFLTATMAALLCGEDLPTAVKYGTVNAAFVVEDFGAQKGLRHQSVLAAYISQLHTIPLSL